AKALGTLAVRGGTVLRDVFEDAFPALSAAVAKAPARAIDAELANVYRAEDQGSTHCLALSADGKLGAAARNHNELMLFSPDNGNMRWSAICHRHDVTAVAFSPHATWLASGSADRT